MNKKALFAALLVATSAATAGTSGTIGMARQDEALIYGTEMRVGDRELFVPATPGLFCGISHFSSIGDFIWTGYSSDTNGVVLTISSLPGLWGMSCISTGLPTGAIIYSMDYFGKSAEGLLTDEAVADPSDMLEQLRSAVQ